MQDTTISFGNTMVPIIIVSESTDNGSKTRKVEINLNPLPPQGQDGPGAPVLPVPSAPPLDQIECGPLVVGNDRLLGYDSKTVNIHEPDTGVGQKSGRSVVTTEERPLIRQPPRIIRGETSGVRSYNERITAQRDREDPRDFRSRLALVKACCCIYSCILAGVGVYYYLRNARA